MAASGWDAIFYFFSLSGTVVLALWLLFAADLPPPSPKLNASVTRVAAATRTRPPAIPSQLPLLPPTGRTDLVGDRAAAAAANEEAFPAGVASTKRSEAVPLMAQMLLAPGAWAIFSLHFLHSVGSYVALSWLPTYLEQRWGWYTIAVALALIPAVLHDSAHPETCIIP